MRDFTRPLHHYIYRVNREDWEEETDTQAALRSP
jgi:hypothetical protein